MPTVWTPSRLHFGLLSLAGDDAAWPDRRGEPRLPARRFGGVGLMVERPGVQVSTALAAEWTADGPLAERALAFARCFVESIRADRPDAVLPPQHIVVESAPPEHVGLGVGTQLGLAVARGLAEAWGLVLDATELAGRVGRGLRSALGVHGFAHGGFLVESGKRPGAEGFAPLAVRAPFPSEWRLVLAIASAARGRHGMEEQQAFAQLARQRLRTQETEALCRVVLLGMLPALAEADLEAFGECLYDFNARVGEAFAAVQGGVYADARTADCAAFLRGEGVRGVGQSSWGPTVFAVVGDEDRASQLRHQLARRFGLESAAAWTTAACNHGADVTASGTAGGR
ncbi:MAG TPA: beta-ribofuranosylaminobenzene 5'-phosphate synthase family protein [Gemmataceae bacterium]|nr:beta-ribofuranosylaminobenzene 5'-phosphate synthase family protein [Gemmataceae bacterium]